MQVRRALCWLEVARACLVSLAARMRASARLVVFESKPGGGSFPVILFHETSISDRWVHLLLRSYALLTCCLILGRSQVVRHRSLEPAFVGSNPPAPAKIRVTSDEYQMTESRSQFCQ